MSISNDENRHGPVLVVDVHEMAEYIRELEGQSQDQHGGYSESFMWQKTDMSGTVDGANTASRLILGGDVRAIGGWIVAETTGAAGAALRLHDGNSGATEAFGRINLAANESTRDFIFSKGIRCQTGRVFLEVIAGAFEGVLFWR